MKPPSQTEQRIFDVLKTLPLKSGITDEHCRVWANNLNGALLFRPVNRNVGTKRATAELAKLASAANKLAKAYNALHNEAREALRINDRDIAAVIKSIYEAEERGPVASKAAHYTDEFTPELTRHAARAFTNLTGRNAKRSVDPVNGKAGGEFIRFLTRFYKATGIKASTEYQAQKLAMDFSRQKRAR